MTFELCDVVISRYPLVMVTNTDITSPGLIGQQY